MRAMQNGGIKEGRESTTEVNPASSSLPDDPHDGRAHTGFSGDDGKHQAIDTAAIPASLQPGHTADLGAAHDTSYDPMPSPAEAYANTGQANTEPARDASVDNGGADEIDSNDRSERGDDDHARD